MLALRVALRTEGTDDSTKANKDRGTNEWDENRFFDLRLVCGLAGQMAQKKQIKTGGLAAYLQNEAVLLGWGAGGCPGMAGGRRGCVNSGYSQTVGLVFAYQTDPFVAATVLACRFVA